LISKTFCRRNCKVSLVHSDVDKSLFVGATPSLLVIDHLSPKAHYSPHATFFLPTETQVQGIAQTIRIVEARIQVEQRTHETRSAFQFTYSIEHLMYFS